MQIRLKKFLNKHKNRIFSFIAVFVCIPLFSISSFAYTSSDVFPFIDEDFLMGVYSNNSYYGYSNPTYRENEGNFIFPNPDFNQISALDFTNHSPLNISDISSVYDYYLAFSCLATATNTGYDVDISKFTFFPTSFSFNARNHDNSLSDLVNGDISYYHLDGFAYLGFAVSCKLDLSNFSDGYYIFISGNGSIPANMVAQGQVIAVPKGLANGDVNQAIVQAINNQTSILVGKIDDTNDFINNGNGSTGGIVSGNNSAIDNLDEVVTEYRATEETFFNDFNTNQQAITSDIVGWSWGGLVNCANWVGETLTSYYNNMGDFRQYIIYPLMLGIALFFLGRGGSIIGHLFRKPTETTVNTKSVFRREGNTRYTTTTTSRQGGVFRK